MTVDRQNPVHHLTLAFGLDKLRGTVWDVRLTVVSEVVVRYQELPGWKNGGEEEDCIENWLSALDTLFDRLAATYQIQGLTSISGTVPTPTHLFITPSFHQAIKALHPAEPLTQLIHPSRLTSATPAFHSDHLVTPNALDTTTNHSFFSFRNTLPLHQSSRTNPFPLNSTPLQLLKLLQTDPQLHQLFVKGTKIVPLSYLVSALLCQSASPEARYVTRQEKELCSGGLWQHGIGWDETYLRALGNRGGGVGGLDILDCDGSVAQVGEVVGQLGDYWKHRWGLGNVSILPFLPSVLASHTSTLPTPTDLFLSTGQIDHFIVPLLSSDIELAKSLGAVISNSLHSSSNTTSHQLDSLRRPESGQSGSSGFILAVFEDVNAGAARMMMRDQYGNGKWTVFGQIAMLIPPGGSNGVDDKLFSFIWPRAQASQYGTTEGMVRYETGLRVSEFRDLRANPRCVLESQFMGLKLLQHSLGLDKASDKIILTGRPGSNPAIPNILSSVFDLPVFVPSEPTCQASKGAAMLALHSLQHHSPRSIEGNDVCPNPQTLHQYIISVLAKPKDEKCQTSMTSVQNASRHPSTPTKAQNGQTTMPFTPISPHPYSPPPKSRPTATARLDILHEVDENVEEEGEDGDEDDEEDWYFASHVRHVVRRDGQLMTPPESPDRAHWKESGTSITATGTAKGYNGVRGATRFRKNEAEEEPNAMKDYRNPKRSFESERWLVKVADGDQGWIHEMYGTMVDEYSRLRYHVAVPLFGTAVLYSYVSGNFSLAAEVIPFSPFIAQLRAATGIQKKRTILSRMNDEL